MKTAFAVLGVMAAGAAGFLAALLTWGWMETRPVDHRR
jgi:hypothetical protein